MSIYFLLFSFILGTIIGSFLNVVAFRYNTGMTLRGRSKCFSCDKTLGWTELFPVLSFLAQEGKCLKCKSKISWQYPLIELASGVLFIMVFYFFPPVSVQASFTTVFYLFITCILIVITVYDIKHKIIPDALVFIFITVSFLHILIAPDLRFIFPTIQNLVAGPAVALPFFLLWLFSKGKWMGLGDAKLVLGIGWTLGLVPSISAITLAFWIGAIVSVVWMIFVFKKLKSHYEIPFGPYLILGMYLVLFFSIKIFDPVALSTLFL